MSKTEKNVVTAKHIEDEKNRIDKILPNSSQNQIQNQNNHIKPIFSPVALSKNAKSNGKDEMRKLMVPQHRFTPLKNSWMALYEPIVNQLKLQIRMNLKLRSIELKASQYTEDPSALHKGAEFIRAFLLGFEIQDALALLRLDDLYIEAFEIKDVKTLHGDHLSRAIGRISGKDGKTKFTIENATKTRIVLADTKIHILGSFQNTKLARNAIVSLILGAPPGKVYNRLKNIASRMNERF